MSQTVWRGSIRYFCSLRKNFFTCIVFSSSFWKWHCLFFRCKYPNISSCFCWCTWAIGSVYLSPLLACSCSLVRELLKSMIRFLLDICSCVVIDCSEWNMDLSIHDLFRKSPIFIPDYCNRSFLYKSYLWHCDIVIDLLIISHTIPVNQSRLFKVSEKDREHGRACLPYDPPQTCLAHLMLFEILSYFDS